MSGLSVEIEIEISRLSLSSRSHTTHTMRISTSLVASSSRAALPARGVRAYAVQQSAQDTRLDVIKSVLYPVDSVAPNSASPIGARHPKYTARLEAVLPSAEAYETIERAWGLYKRNQRLAAEKAIKARFDAMVDACDELEAVSKSTGNSIIYDRAMVRMAHGAAAIRAAAQGEAQGKKKTPESVWKEKRPEGLVPLEQWVPTETKGSAWNYSWERPRNS